MVVRVTLKGRALLSQYDEVDEFEGNEDNGPKALRDLVKKLRKELAETTAERDTLKTESRKTNVAAVLATKGLPAKLAGLYTGEPDEASIDAWATEYADVFGIPSTVTETNEHTAPEAQAQYDAMNRAQSSGNTPLEGNAAMAKRLDEVASLDELVALINAKG